MSLPKERGQGSLLSARWWAPSLFDGESRYRVFQEKVLPVLRRVGKELDRLYCAPNGRPAIEPVVMAGVTVLQFMERVPDRGAVERVRYHLGWKYGLDLPLDYKGFHPTSLVTFRARLLEGEEERRVFDAVVEGLREAGLVKKGKKQRLDSTHVLGCVSQMSRLEVVRETIGVMLKEMAKRGVGQGFEEWETYEERYGESEVDWRNQSAEQLKEKFRQAGEDALRLLKWVRGQRESVRGSEAAVLLERVFLEQYELGEGGVARREKEGSGTVKNPHEPEAQWAAKDTEAKTAWVGYKAQVRETVREESEPKPKGEPTDQFLTDLTTTKAIASDLAGMDQSLEATPEDKPSELYTDAAYVTDDTLAEAQAEGRELVGPARPSPEREGVIPSEAFDVHVAERRAVCPAGKTSTQCSLIHDAHAQHSYYRFEWGAQCDGCVRQKECTQSKTGRRTLVVGLHHDLLQARRREMKTEAFRDRMRQRNGIEGTIHELTWYGLRRSRYRGLAKTRLANYFIGAACNINRWIRLTIWQARSAYGGLAVA